MTKIPVDTKGEHKEIVDENAIKPVSATYSFQGNVDMSKLKRVLDDAKGEVHTGSAPGSDYRQIIFDVLFDNNRTIEELVLVNSSFFSSIYSNLEPFNDETAGFQLTKVWTTCKFTSIARAQTQYEALTNPENSKNVENTKANVLPLSEPPEKVNLQDKSNNVLFGTERNGLLPSTKAGVDTINPPFYHMFK